MQFDLRTIYEHLIGAIRPFSMGVALGMLLGLGLGWLLWRRLGRHKESR